MLLSSSGLWGILSYLSAYMLLFSSHPPLGARPRNDVPANSPWTQREIAMLRHLQNNKNRIVTMLVALSGLSITVRFMDAHQSTGNQQAAVLPNAGARRERPHLNVRKGESSFKTASPSLSDVHLEPVVTYSSAGFSAGSIAVADLNGDGKPDLAVSNDLD